MYVCVLSCGNRVDSLAETSLTDVARVLVYMCVRACVLDACVHATCVGVFLIS